MGEAHQAQIRQLLRHLDDPDSLQQNVIAKRCHTVGADVRECVLEAILGLPEPLRSIVARCDLAKELHATVAAELGISERHFYRHRRQALLRLWALLSVRRRASKRLCVTQPDPIQVRLSYAIAQQNAGRFDGAIAALLDVQASILDTAKLAQIACRLADTCCAAGRLVEARSYLNKAQGLATLAQIADEPGSNVVEAELEAAKINLAWCCGDLEYIRNFGDRVAHQLRPVAHASMGSPIAVEAFASFLLVLADFKGFKGAFGEGLVVALEAMALLDRLSFPNDALRLRCINTIADLRTYIGYGLDVGVNDLSDAYTRAQTKGIPRAAVNIAVNLSGVYMRRGRMELALDFGYAALKIARSVCPDEEFARNCLAVAAIHLFRSEVRPARALLSKAHAHISAENSYVAALATLFEGDIYLVERNHREALAAARSSAHTFKRLSMERFVASAYRVEAEAQEGLGDHLAAVRTIGDSLSLLGSSGHPFVLARAYRSSARICQERKHQLVADNLTRELRA
jgi:tetratricopeptide (TPR) repeat protein